MLRRYWIVAFFCMVFSSAVFASLDQALAQYQGAWSRQASEDTLSKVIIEHPHQAWLINVYKHCQEKDDCLVASTTVKPTLVHGQLNELTTFWQKQFPNTKHIVLVYQLVLTPIDREHMSWQIFIRDEHNLRRLVASLHGVLTRDVPQNIIEAPQTSKTNVITKPQLEKCQDIKVKCMLASNPTLTIGNLTIKQRQIKSSSGVRCLPWQMQNYDAKNLALLFQYNNLTCSQQFAAQCAKHRCIAIIDNFKDLGRID